MLLRKMGIQCDETEYAEDKCQQLAQQQHTSMYLIDRNQNKDVSILLVPEFHQHLR